MDFRSLAASLQTTLVESLPNILGALLILLALWIVALIVRAAVRRSLAFVRLNERVRTEAGGRVDLEGGVARGAFYIVLLFAVIAFFNALDLPLVSAPLQVMMERFLAFVPNLIAGLVLAMVAWVVATVSRRLITALLGATTLDDRLSREAGMQPMSKSLGNATYGLVLLLFLPAVLGALELQGLLDPVRQMVEEILGLLPNIVGAAILGVVGWFVARLLRNLVTSLLETAGADTLGSKLGLAGNLTLSRLAGLVVMILVFVPALIAALDTLRLEAISRPATEMLGTLMDALPDLFAAALILAIAIAVGRFAGEMVTALLAGMGFDRLPERLGLPIAWTGDSGPSRLAGRIVVFFILLFATVEAAEVLGFSQLSTIVAMFIEFGGEVLLGVAIIAVGTWISGLAAGALERFERPNAAFVAGMARVAILGLVLAMGLRAMGIADDIVKLAFGLSLGAVAVAIALAFGLGGREAAGRQMEHWLRRLRGES